MELKPFWLRLKQSYHTWKCNLLFSLGICYHCGWRKSAHDTGGFCYHCWHDDYPMDQVE